MTAVTEQTSFIVLRKVCGMEGRDKVGVLFSALVKKLSHFQKKKKMSVLFLENSPTRSLSSVWSLAVLDGGEVEEGGGHVPQQAVRRLH